MSYAGINRFRTLIGGLILALGLSFNSVHADDETPVPQPSPTNAAAASIQTYTSKGRVPINGSLESARFAALLDAYQALLADGMKNGWLPGEWSPITGTCRRLVLDEEHPNPQLISWVTRAKVISEKSLDDHLEITLQSPPSSELATPEPVMRAFQTQDVNGDGNPDVVSLGYDGSIYVSQTEGAHSKIIAQTPTFASIDATLAPGLQRLITKFPTAILSLEPAGPARIRILLDFQTLEAVNGVLLGQSKEQREILVPLDGLNEDITFTIDDPPDFARMFLPSIELRGRVVAPRPLASLDITQNGQAAWSNPEGLALSALQFNLQRTLEPGWNFFCLSASDVLGHRRQRSLWLHAEQPSPQAPGPTKQAIILTLDDELKQAELVERLVLAGFAKDHITLLSNKDITAQRLLQTIIKSGPSDLLIYLEAKSRPGTLATGTVLQIGQDSVSSLQLEQALAQGKHRRCLTLIHTESILKPVSLTQSWLATTSFLTPLSGAGKLALTNLNSSQNSLRSQRLRARNRLLDALKTTTGGDLLRLFDYDDPRGTIFRGWMFGAPLLGGTEIPIHPD